MISIDKTLLFRRSAIKHPQIVRFYEHWLRSLSEPGSTLNDEIPWLNYGAIDWLEKNVNSSTNVFEWGSGGSTLFVAKAAKSIVSIEHNPTWYDYVLKSVKMRNLQNVFIKLIEGQPLSVSKKAYL
jgi:hypothetical protein